MMSDRSTRNGSGDLIAFDQEHRDEIASNKHLKRTQDCTL